MVRFKPKSKIELQLALTRYLDPRYNGFNNYTIGSPEIWNTCLITDMSHLFEEATKYLINPEFYAKQTADLMYMDELHLATCQPQRPCPIRRF